MTELVSTRAAGSPLSDTELLATLFELGREVTSVLDFDELLQKIPQLISRLTTFSVFAVYLLDERREICASPTRVGYPEEVVKDFRLEGRPGTRRHRGRRAAADPGQRRRRRSALVMGVVPGIAIAVSPCRCGTRARCSARSTCCPSTRTRSPSATKRCCASSPRTWRRRIVNARLFESEREYAQDARDARRDRARDERHPRSRRAAHARRASGEAAHRLSHVRHRAAQRRRPRCSR